MEILGHNDTPKSIYWGTAPTGMPHIGYLIPFGHLKKFMAKGIEVKVLIADKHAIIEGVSPDVVEYRCAIYETIIRHFLGPDVTIVRGSSFQDTAAYNNDLFQYARKTTVTRAIRAASGVVKGAEDPTVTDILYPLMQALDDRYMGTEGQMGGTDQRRIFALSRSLVNTKTTPLTHFIHPMMATAAGKMSSSNNVGKIAFDFSNKNIRRSVSRINPDYIPAEDCMLLQIYHACEGFVEGFTPDPNMGQKWLLGQVTTQDLNILVSDMLISIITPLREKLDAGIIKAARFG